MVPLYLWLMDVGKYGIGIVGNYWMEEIAYISEIVEKQEMFLNAIPMGPMRKVKQTRPVKGYQGNKVYNVRPMDFFPDPRVPMSRFQDGEYCAIYCELSWAEIKRRENQGYYFNIEELRKTTGSDESERTQGSSQVTLPDINDSGFETSVGLQDTKPKGLYEVHINLVPSEWKLGKSDFTEKWVFTADKTFSVLIGAQPLGAIHNKFPFNVLELEPEAYGLFSRSMPDIVKPLQNTIDWLLNSHFWNVRKTLNDMFIVDPSRVMMRDFLDTSTEAGLMVRLKPRAYGQDPKSVVTQLPVIDVTRAHINDISFIMELGQRVTGVNDQIMGMSSGAGRRTAAEVRTSTTFGVNRLKTSSEYFSAMGWAPLSQMLVQNSQQYYEMEQKFRIVGDLSLLAGPQFAMVTPESIQGFFDFVPVDGTLPADRFAQANLWRELFAQMRNFPQIMMQYDVGKIFAWVAQLSGLKNINQFKIQIGSPEEMLANATAGNIVPIGGARGGPPKRGERDLGRVPEPGQVSGMGTTG